MANKPPAYNPDYYTGPGDLLLAKLKHHHKKAFEYISKGLKVDEENETDKELTIELYKNGIKELEMGLFVDCTGKGEVYKKAHNLQQKMRTNLIMAKERLQMIDDPPPPYQSSQVPPTVHAAYVGTTTGSTTYIHTTTQPSYGTIPVVVQPVRAADVIIVGGCPACRVGVLNEEFTLPGLCCAFWFFPIGILCCLAMRERRCTNCGAIFS